MPDLVPNIKCLACKAPVNDTPLCIICKNKSNRFLRGELMLFIKLKANLTQKNGIVTITAGDIVVTATSPYDALELLTKEAYGGTIWSEYIPNSREKETIRMVMAAIDWHASIEYSGSKVNIYSDEQIVIGRFGQEITEKAIHASGKTIEEAANKYTDLWFDATFNKPLVS